MFNKEVKTNIFNMQRASVICGLLFAAAFALLPASAGAQCTNWDAGGKWWIIQPGLALDGITLRLEQKGRVLTGTAHTIVSDGKKGGKYQDGTVDGTIDGDRFNVQIFWSNNDTGVYDGKVLPSGRLDGEGYEKRSSNIRVPWHSYGVLKCARAAAPSKPFKITSKITLPKTTSPPSGNKTPTIEPPPPPMKVPGIIASQAVFPYVGALSGFAVLTWDSGPDHPYAEVWVKVNGGDATFVVEQGKGGRQVTVERGRAYLYILTDDGKTLATVDVVPLF